MGQVPNSTAQRDIDSFLHPYTNLKTHQETGPLVISRGEGVRVYDEQGNSYIEAMSGLWCTSLGFNQQRLVDAATKAMSDLPNYHVFSGKSHEPGITLAEMLLERSPVPMSKVFFANSGSEANDTAMKIVWYVNNAWGRPERKKIISREKAYHGVTIASASLTGLANNHRDFDLPIDRVIHTSCPHYYRYGRDGESEEAFAARCADELENLIIAEGPETIAAFFAEPVMGAGGVIVPPNGYFEKIQAVLRKYDILFVVDEVICGFGRTGKMFGSETFDLKPDIITVSKALSSGYIPISAVLISDAVFQGMVTESEKIGIFGHGFTFGGHPVPASVAIETLKIYDDMNILKQVNTVAPTLQDGLRELADHPLVGEARGIGLVGALELIKNKETKEPFDSILGVGARLMTIAQENGLITRALGDTIAFSPPLIISHEDIETVLEITKRCLDETMEWAGNNAQT